MRIWIFYPLSPKSICPVFSVALSITCLSALLNSSWSRCRNPAEILNLGFSWTCIRIISPWASFSNAVIYVIITKPLSLPIASKWKCDWFSFSIWSTQIHCRRKPSSLLRHLQGWSDDFAIFLTFPCTISFCFGPTPPNHTTRVKIRLILKWLLQF